MEIPKFAWWLSNEVAVVWRKITQCVADFIEEIINRAFAVARIGTTTETGLQIFWDDAKIKPPVSDDLKRAFLQNYDQFLKTVGTPKVDRVIESVLSIQNLDSIDMRDHSKYAHLYRYWAVRYYILPEHLQLLTKIKELIEIMLPARCIKHYHIIVIQNDGFFCRRLTRRFARKYGN